MSRMYFTEINFVEKLYEGFDDFKFVYWLILHKK